MDLSFPFQLIVYGPGTVAPSTFKVLKQGLHYSLLVILSNVTSGRVVITTAKKIYRDAAGNIFTRSDNSTSIIHFDRNPVTVNLYTGISDFQVIINNEVRTIHATNKLSDLVLYLDFSEPVTNTTEEPVTLFVAAAMVALHMEEQKMEK